MAIALYILAALMALGGALWLGRALRGDPARGRLRCGKCWYDMRGSPGLVCPECGHDANTPGGLERTRRSRPQILVAVLLIVLALYPRGVAHRIRYDHESEKLAACPTTLLALAYPLIKPPHRDLIVTRFERMYRGDAGTWSWQRWLLAKQIAHAYRRSNKDVRAVDDLAALGWVSHQALVELLAIHASVESDPWTRARIEGQVMEFVWDPRNAWLVPQLVQWADARTQRGRFRESRVLSALPEPVLDQLDTPTLVSVVRTLSRDGIGEFERFLTLVQGRGDAAIAPLQALCDEFGRMDSPDRDWTIVRTVLRRVQHRTPPVVVELDATGPITARAGALPTIGVALKNLETEHPRCVGVPRAKVLLWRGEKRPENWRIVLTRGDGFVEPVLPGYAVLAPALAHPLDDTYPLTADLDLNLFVNPPRGRYRMTIQFHDASAIAGANDVSSMVVYESAPAELIVTE